MKFFFVLVIFAIVSVHCRAGDESANGGDAYASEFILTAKSLLEKLKPLPAEQLLPLKLELFAEAITNTEVHSEAKLTLKENEVDAINYPEKKQIRLSRQRWEVLRADLQNIARNILVLHEYLGVMGLDDSQYRYSQRLIDAVHCSNPLVEMSLPRPEHPMSDRATHVVGIALDSGIGKYTGGTHHDSSAAFYKGGTLSLYFVPAYAVDFSVHSGNSTTYFGLGTFDVALTSILVGSRYHFSFEQLDWINFFHPYVTAGGGLYLQRLVMTGWKSVSINEEYFISNSATRPGIYAGIGSKLFAYDKQLSLGLDIRYHQVFFKHEDFNFTGGGYLTGTLAVECLL